MILSVGRHSHALIQRGDGGMGGGVSDPPPLKNHKNIGFLSNTGPDSLKTKACIKCWAAIEMAFRWQTHDVPPFLVLF